MLQTISKRALATLTILSILSVSVAAQTLRNGDEGAPESAVSTGDRPETSSQQKLKKDVGKLVAETKAGHLKFSNSMPKTSGKGLSKGAKIGIGVGIGVVVLAIIALHVRKHMFDGFNLSPLLGK